MNNVSDHTLQSLKNLTNMKTLNQFLLFSLMSFLLISTSGCELVETVFKAGMWWGIILVVGGIFLVIFLIGKVFGGKK